MARAHELMAAGDHAPAAELFSRVAALAAGHQHFRRAGQLYAQAARATLQAGDLAQAMAHADRAIAALIQGRDLPHAARLAERMEGELRALGYTREAQALHDKLDARLAELGVAAAEIRAGATSATIPSTELPGQCHACLGPVRSDEVEWVDETSAACAYCGTILKAA